MLYPKHRPLAPHSGGASEQMYMSAPQLRLLAISVLATSSAETAPQGSVTRRIAEDCHPGGFHESLGAGNTRAILCCFGKAAAQQAGPRPYHQAQPKLLQFSKDADTFFCQASWSILGCVPGPALEVHRASIDAVVVALPTPIVESTRSPSPCRRVCAGWNPQFRHPYFSP